MPIIDGSVVLHPRIAAEIGALGDHPKQITRFKSLTDFTVFYITSLPLPVFLHSLHKLIGYSHRVIGILKKNASIGRSVYTGVISGLDKSPSLLLLFNLALDEFFDVGVIDV